MTEARLDQAIGFITAHQNPDGGWGYQPGRRSLVEPTAFCAIALLSRGEVLESGRGLAFLKSCQKESGAIGAGLGDAEGNWMAYSALLAFQAFGVGPEKKRLLEWILGMEDASGLFTPADVKATAEAYRYDASIPGWSWTPRTTAWVEPTALFILALRHAGVPANEEGSSSVST